jgi:O-antigen/teichoic acid export membrane protein
LGIVSGPILARILAPEGRGQLAAIMQPITIGSAVAIFGIPTTITYFAGKGYSVRELKKVALLSLLTTTTFVYVLLILYAHILSETQEIHSLTLICIWSFLYISVIVELQRSILLGNGSFKRLDSERFLFSISRFFCILLFWKFSIASAELISLILLTSFTLTAVILWYPQNRQSISGLSISFRDFSKYMFPAAAVSISAVLAARIDQVLLPLQISSAEVGFYAVGVTVAEVPLFFAVLAGRVALHSSSIGESISVQFQKSRFYLVSGFMLSVLLLFVSQALVVQIFGTEFEPSYEIIQVLLFSTFISLPNAVIISTLCGTGNETKAALASCSALLPIAVIFALQWGEIGGYEAAWINALSQLSVLIVGSLLLVNVTRKTY